MALIVNGKPYDYSNIETVLPLLGIVKQISEINYSDTIEKGQLRGQAPHNMGWTDGQYDAEASFVIEKQYHTALMAAAALAAPLGDLRKWEFPLTVIYGNFGLPLINDKLVGCVLMGNEQSNSQGSDALMVSVTLGIKAVFWNGVNPLGASALDLGVSAI